MTNETKKIILVVPEMRWEWLISMLFYTFFQLLSAPPKTENSRKNVDIRTFCAGRIFTPFS
jgi:hypothetical protein